MNPEPVNAFDKSLKSSRSGAVPDTMNQDDVSYDAPCSAVEGVCTQTPPDETQEELSKLIRGMKHDLMGILWLGNDGVLRTLTADRDVVDAIPLNPKLLKAFLERMPFDQKMEDIYRGVDGTKTTRQQWYNPDKSTMPAPLSEEKKAEARKFQEEHKELLGKRQEQIRKGEFKGCPVLTRSTYNLDPQ